MGLDSIWFLHLSTDRRRITLRQPHTCRSSEPSQTEHPTAVTHLQDAGLRLVLMTLQAAAHDEGASSTDPGGRGNAAVTPVAVAELLLRLCWERPQLHARVAAAVSRNLLPVDWAAAAAWAASQLDALVSAGVSAASVGRRASAGPGAAPPTLPSLEGPALAEALLSRSQSWLAAWLGTVADVAGANHVVDVCRRHLLLLPATATPTAMPAGAPAAVAAAAEVTLPAVDDLLVLAAKCLAAVCIAACPPGAGGGGDGNHDALGAAPQEAAAAGETAVWAMLTAAAEAAVQQQRPQQLARLLACGLAVCELLPRGGGSAVGSSATGSGGGSSSEGFDRLAAALLPHGPGALQTLLLSSDALHAAASACPSRPALQRLDAAVRRHLLQPPAASQEARDIGSQMLQVIASAAASAAATAGGSSGGQQCLQAAAPGATFLRHIGGSSGGRAIDASGAAAAAAQTASASDPKWSTALVECLTEWETQGATALVKLRGIKVRAQGDGG